MSGSERRRVHVWHDAEGTILAVGIPSATSGAEVEIAAVPVAQGELEILETEVEHDAIERLHESHRVDFSAAELRAR